MNAAAQDLRAAGGDLCGVLSNTSFGTNVLTNNFDPGLLEGWGIRPSDWHLGVSLEQQIGSRSSVAVTYTRRWYDGFSLVDNRALQPSDLTPFSIVAPVDPRLPDGGGYVISGLYDVVPEKAGVVDNLVADSTAYGNWYQYFNGVDVTVRVRSVKGFTVAAGTSTGQTVADNCAVRAHLPELATTTTGTSAFGAGSRRLRRHAGEPVLPRRVRRPHAAARLLFVRRPQDRHAAVGDVSEQAWPHAGGELRRSECRGRAIARTETSRAMPPMSP